VGEIRNVYTILVGNSQWKRLFWISRHRKYES